jgi:spore maturation protein CgeB
MFDGLRITILGLSLTSSWGNGHATTYRGLIRELSARGHKVSFLERDVPWYASKRDLPDPSYCELGLYDSLDELKQAFQDEVRNADVIIVGSYVPEGVAVGKWVCDVARGVTCFYDIDTPVTLTKLKQGDYEYISPDLVGRYDLYLSFTGGPTLQILERLYGSKCARPLYCSFDPEMYFPEETDVLWDLGYLGTYSFDRQPTLEKLLVEPALRWQNGVFAVAGPQYPDDIEWPPNVHRIDHIPPSEHREFYNAQRFTLNVTRADMIRAGFSPSVRLFEAAACGVPVISDYWRGLEDFFIPGEEILIAECPDESLSILRNLSEIERRRIGGRARSRVMAEHTAAHRAAELESYALEAMEACIASPLTKA